MPYNTQVQRTDGQALMPEEVAREIIKSVPAQSAALRLFRHVPMSRKQMRMPVLEALAQAYWVQGDTGLKQTTNESWGNKYLVAEELAVIIPVPEAVMDDADYDIFGEIKPNLVEAFGAAIDAAVFFGDSRPASWPLDISTAAAAAGNHFTRGSITGQDLANDINAVMGLVEGDGFDVNGFVAKKGIKASLRGLRNTQGSLLFQPSLQAGTPATLYGEDIGYVQNGSWDPAVADLIAGDFTQGILGMRQDLTYKVFTEGVITDNNGAVILNLMQQDAVALRAVMRIGFQVANPITRMAPTEASRYPFSVLRPAGFSGA